MGIVSYCDRRVADREYRIGRVYHYPGLWHGGRCQSIYPGVRCLRDVVDQLQPARELDQHRPDLFRESIHGTGWGATAGLLLTLAHHRFPWWPLHPIGFGVAQAFGTTFVVFSVFLSWFIKLLLLKIGGGGLYRRSRPFFVGMMVGYVVAVAVSYGVDVIWFPQNGHVLHSW